ncbi:hypothetical protein HB364_26920 [Pseudoflavitalea sp. X16]|uniref:hypothetical protein n=1 Tax=Paraflavitalea devenefica TaxID=2716334 RepID=UPI001423DCA6|nr:hypothetical protein [Paraflavitalea devenefica]NII28743.1 hypothetical protein [Paraflavitalea devenefica]
MAKQKGTHRFTGKMGATIGYKLKDEFIERENGSKEGKAFKKDPRRWRTMHYAGLFAQASQTVKFIYRALPEDQQQHGVYGKLSGMAFTMIKTGKTVEEVKEVLTKQYVEDKKPLVEEVVAASSTQSGTSSSGDSAKKEAVDTGTSSRQPAPSAFPQNRDRPCEGETGRTNSFNPERDLYVMATVTMPGFYSTVCR